MRRTQIFLLVALSALALMGCKPGLDVAAPPPATSSPAQLTMPDVVGLNADVAQDTLRKDGFTNIAFGTVDGRRVVVLPQNWTVKAQSTKAGAELAPDAKIVLGCARIGGTRWF
jgi:PASTA domain